MSCAGTQAVLGQNYVSDAFTASSSSLVVKVGGNPVAADVFGSDPYTVKVYALDIRCPGPIEVFDGTHVAYCAKITGC